MLGTQDPVAAAVGPAPLDRDCGSPDDDVSEQEQPRPSSNVSWQDLIAQVAQAGHSWLRLENASWRIWLSDHHPPSAADKDGLNLHPKDLKLSPSPKMGSRKNLFRMVEDLLPSPIARLPSVVADKLIKPPMQDKLSWVFGEPLVQFVKSRIPPIDGSDLSYPTTFSPYRLLVQTLGWPRSAPELPALEVEDRIAQLQISGQNDDTTFIGPRYQTISAEEFAKCSMTNVSAERPASLLSQLLDDTSSPSRQDTDKAAALRRNKVRYLRRRALDIESELKRGLDVETYMRMSDGCSDSRHVASELPANPSCNPFGDVETRRKRTDTAQSLIGITSPVSSFANLYTYILLGTDPTWRIRNIGGNGVTWQTLPRKSLNIVTETHHQEEEYFAVW
ncbi:hypothetical protein DFS34DRAFT_502001 [Phlyctochytrium arcticum]|nr:hypothetical protein DFS34DRAFT_502001 [Phlyctochytrium arcticum]